VPPPEDPADAAITPDPCAPARPAPAGQTAETLTVDGVERTYLLDVPTTYDGEEPVPLIVDLHGSSSDASQQVLYSGLPDAAEETATIVATLDGTGTPRGFALSPASADVEVVSTLVDELGDRFCIDADRIASVGISNGSAMSATLACALDGRLASIGLVAATIAPFGCDDDVRTSVIAFHGTADETVPYGGGIGGPGVDLAPAEEGIAAWAEQDRCDPAPETTEVADDVRRWEYEGCDGGTDVAFYRVEGAGHVWPGSPIPFDLLEARLGPNTDSVDAAALVVDFVATHPRSS
jgi:polyhydroxybutyrate depolymerase